MYWARVCTSCIGKHQIPGLWEVSTICSSRQRVKTLAPAFQGLQQTSAGDSYLGEWHSAAKRVMTGQREEASPELGAGIENCK